MMRKSLVEGIVNQIERDLSCLKNNPLFFWFRDKEGHDCFLNIDKTLKIQAISFIFRKVAVFFQVM